jgi:membrane fusion protein, multidrug efflux system
VNPLRIFIFLVVVLVGATATFFFYNYQLAHPATADAYLDMHRVRIAPQVSGPVAKVQVHSHQLVKHGDLLFTIDAKPFELALEQAQAKLEQARQSQDAAQAEVLSAKAQMDAAQASLQEMKRHAQRVLNLVAKGTASKDDGDAVRKALESAQDALASTEAQHTAAIAKRGAEGERNAMIKAALASRDQARLNLQHTRVVAPADGIVGEVVVRPGSFVETGQALFPLVETNEVWVDANFKETDLPHIHPGQPAQVKVDLQPGQVFKGRVISMSPASGTAFSLFPPENATGNWVKVTQRFPVRVRILDPKQGLRVGASSEVTIDTTQTP